MKINGKSVYLKSLSIKDSYFIYNLRKKKKISLYLHSPPEKIKDQKNWIKDNIKKKETLDFVIICKKTQKKIGTIGFDKINKLSAEWGRWISLGSTIQNIEAIIILLNYGFNNLKLKKIYSLTNKNNNKVVNFHRKTTAKYDGVKKSLFLINKKKVDAVKYTFTKKKFKEFENNFNFISQSILQ